MIYNIFQKFGNFAEELFLKHIPLVDVMEAKHIFSTQQPYNFRFFIPLFFSGSPK